MKVKRQFFTEENVERLYKEGGGLTLEEVAGLFKQDVEENMKEMKEGSVDFGEILEPYKGCGSVEEVTERAKGILEGDVQRAKGGGNVVFDVLNSGVFVGYFFSFYLFFSFLFFSFLFFSFLFFFSFSPLFPF